MNPRWRLFGVLVSFLCLMGCEKANKPAALSPELQAGKAVVDSTCRVCHVQGINGAPIIGNSKMWAPRLQQGTDVLVQHAIEGFSFDMMPARGGNPELSDEDIRLAVKYMVSRLTAD